jgi:hypothetical protein
VLEFALFAHGAIEIGSAVHDAPVCPIVVVVAVVVVAVIVVAVVVVAVVVVAVVVIAVVVIAVVVIAVVVVVAAIVVVGLTEGAAVLELALFSLQAIEIRLTVHDAGPARPVIVIAVRLAK